MRGPLHLRELTSEEERVVGKLARSQSASKRLVERAKIIQLAKEGQSIPQIVQQLHLSEPMVRKWWKRFEQQGLAGLEDAARPGAPSHYTPEDKAQVLEAALTRPSDLNLGFTYWTFDRLAVYVRERLGLPMKKTRIFEILQEEGLYWRKQETWFGERLDPEFAQKGGHRAAPQGAPFFARTRAE
jgi:transposase